MKLEKEDFLKYYNQERKPDTHKGDYGHVFIVAGSEGMTGAAMLCAESAIRTGAGLVYLFSPGKLLPIYETSCKEAVKIKTIPIICPKIGNAIYLKNFSKFKPL